MPLFSVFRPSKRLPGSPMIAGATVCAAAFALLLATGCTGSGVRSTGASLPLDAEEFDDGTLKVALSHGCGGVRCDSVVVTFQNLGDEALTVQSSGMRLVRAGQSVMLQRAGETKGPLTLPPKESKKETLVPVAEGGKRRMSYTRPKEVWCSLKAPSSCKDVSKAEAACAGFARYYYDTYMSTGGWLSFQFPYQTSLRKETLVSPKPQAPKLAPSVTLEENGRAPWFSTSPSDVVFYKIACNEACSCKEVSPRRNFFLDDKIQAEFK